MNKSIYTTGLTGFIGKSLLPNLLLSFDQVINFTRNGTIQIFAKDEESEDYPTKDFLLSNPSNIFINLATLYQPVPSNLVEMERLIEANIFFPSRVLEQLELFNNLKIINALSYTQLLDFKNQNIYSLSKEILKIFVDKKFSNIVNIFIFDTFGPRDSRNKVTDVFIKNILLGNPIKIPENEIRINLSDSSAVSETLLNATLLSPGNYSIKSPDTISLEALALKLMSLCDKQVDVIKKNIGTDHFGLIQELPKNIFQSPQGYDLDKALLERIHEISQSAEFHNDSIK